MSWAPSGFRGSRTFTEGEAIEVRPLPSQKDWERATFVRRIRQDEMPALWRGPLGYVVKLRDGRTTTLSGHRIRKLAHGSALEIGASVRVADRCPGFGGALDRYGTVVKIHSDTAEVLVKTKTHSGWVRVEDITRVA